jgi:hypothetical protein
MASRRKALDGKKELFEFGANADSGPYQEGR